MLAHLKTEYLTVSACIFTHITLVFLQKCACTAPVFLQICARIRNWSHFRPLKAVNAWVRSAFGNIYAVVEDEDCFNK